MLPADTSLVLQFMGYTPLADFGLAADGTGGVVIEYWDPAAGRQPTDAEINAAWNDATLVEGITYSAWYAVRAYPKVTREADVRVNAIYGTTDNLSLFKRQTADLADSNALVRKLAEGGTLVPEEQARLDEADARLTTGMLAIRGKEAAMQAEMSTLAVDTKRLPPERRAAVDAYTNGIAAPVAAPPRTIDW